MRCDRCCARARTWWESESDPDGWAYCAHHAREHGTALEAFGYELWMDGREALETAPAVASVE